MQVDEYQAGTATTAVYGNSIYRMMNYHGQNIPRYLRLAYCSQKLNGEAGEVGELVGKLLRDKMGLVDAEFLADLEKELGDVLWYVSQLCNEVGFKLEDVMQTNLSKLQSRKQRDKIHGKGSDR